MEPEIPAPKMATTAGFPRCITRSSSHLSMGRPARLAARNARMQSQQAKANASPPSRPVMRAPPVINSFHAFPTARQMPAWNNASTTIRQAHPSTWRFSNACVTPAPQPAPTTPCARQRNVASNWSMPTAALARMPIAATKNKPAQTAPPAPTASPHPTLPQAATAMQNSSLGKHACQVTAQRNAESNKPTAASHRRMQHARPVSKPNAAMKPKPVPTIPPVPRA